MLHPGSYFQTLSQTLQETEVTDFEGRALSLDEGGAAAVDVLLAAGTAKRKVMIIGNGGSAAIASHVQNDLMKAVGIRAMVFTEASLATAIANDHSYQEVYERQLCQWADWGDVLIAISSSGASDNILRAVKAALRSGCRVITLSGFADDNPLRRMGHVNLYTPAQSYGVVEVAHQAVLHYLTDAAMAMADKKAGTAPTQRDLTPQMRDHDYEIHTTGFSDRWRRVRRLRPRAQTPTPRISGEGA